MAGIYTAFTLTRDVFGYATMIGDAWPIVRAFLPLIGSTLFVFFVCLMIFSAFNDIPDFFRKMRTKRINKIYYERKAINDCVEFVAENIKIRDEIPIEARDEILKTKV